MTGLQTLLYSHVDATSKSGFIWRLYEFVSLIGLTHFWYLQFSKLG